MGAWMPARTCLKQGLELAPLKLTNTISIAYPIFHVFPCAESWVTYVPLKSLLRSDSLGEVYSVQLGRNESKQ